MNRIEFLEMGLIGKRKVLLGRRCIYIIYADRWVWEGKGNVVGSMMYLVVNV